MQPTRTHWRSIALLLAFALGILLFLVASLVAGVRSVVTLLNGSADPTGDMIKSFASGFELILLLICGWFMLQRIRHQPKADLPFRYPFAGWQIYVSCMIFVFSIALGTMAAVSEIRWLNWLLLPTLTILTVLLPIFLFLGIGTRGIPFGPRWKAWSTVGIGMTIGPALMITLESLALFFFALLGFIALSGHPEVIRELLRIGKLLAQNVSEETAVELLAPYIVQPVTIASLFIYLSLVVPLIEELLKPLAVWLFAKNLNSPTNGFALGMLGGAAFALVESLNVSSDGGSGWSVVVLVRAGTSLLHMTTSGLMGFAIVELFQGKRLGRFLATYLAAILLHGLWNACAIGAGLASVGEMVGRPEWIWDLPAALGGIGVLSAGIFVVLVAANRRVRRQVPAAQEAAPEEGVK
jgi:RsiW-degrading membrane proteinase PrsW (M82 family)